MNPTLRQIRSFVVVANRGSFTQAAKLLHLSQPALTVQIRLLEESLGVRLFDRNTRTVKLTRTGRELTPRLERLQQELESVIASTRDLANVRRGVVRLASLPSFASSGLPDAITAFRASHPEISFAIRDAVWSRVVAMVQSEEVDFGIGDAPNHPELEFIPLRVDRMNVVFPANHPLARVRKVTLQRLAEYPLVMMAPETSARGMIDAAFEAVGRFPVRACEIAYMATAVAMVRAGLGIAILPSAAIDWRAHSNLCARLIDDTTFVRSLGIIKKAGRSLPPPSDAFCQALLNTFRGRRPRHRAA